MLSVGPDRLPAMEFTAVTALLAEAAALIVRLLPGRGQMPAGVMVRAVNNEVELVGGDGELSVRARVAAVVREPGAVSVPRRALAATLGSLTCAEVRLTAAASRLTLRTPMARYALPAVDSGQPPTELPPVMGHVYGRDLRAAAGPVAYAASRDHALPIFTGVRLRTTPDGLSLLATDRYRMASAVVRWSGGSLDTLVPASWLAETAKLGAAADQVHVHADERRFGLSWSGVGVVGGLLGQPFPDDQAARILHAEPEAHALVDAGDMLGAVERVALYAGSDAGVSVQFSDGVLVVRGSDEATGDAEEAVKATVEGALLTQVYQARYLLDALRCFATGPLTLNVQSGTRPTVITRPSGEDPVNLRQLIVPLRGR